MMSDTETLIKALRILSEEIQTDDGVANACLREAADRLGKKHLRVRKLKDFIRRYRYRMKGGEPMQRYIDELMEKDDE